MFSVNYKSNIRLLIFQFILIFNFEKIAADDEPRMVRTYELFPGFFPQGKELLPRRFLLKNYFRRFSLFREFSTLAVFDVIPVCGEFFNHYHTLRLASVGYEMNDARTYLLSLKNELTSLANGEVVFFLFADLKVGNDVGLDVKSSPWHISLMVGERVIISSSIEFVKNDIALEEALSPWFDRFRLKKIYKVTFPLPKDITTNIELRNSCKIFANYLGFQGYADLPNIDGYKAPENSIIVDYKS